MVLHTELIRQVNKELAIELTEKISLEELQRQLAEHINHLIKNNFEQLVNLLYRIDVSEAKIKSLLQHNPGQDSAAIIASLIIERQLEKIKTRRQYSQWKSDFDEEEKW
jgi:hypothetical protein